MPLNRSGLLSMLMFKAVGTKLKVRKMLLGILEKRQLIKTLKIFSLLINKLTLI